jgi:phage shock protein A
LEGELDAMALGREKTGLAAEIDALASDDALNDELEALRQAMKTEEATSSTSQ